MCVCERVFVYALVYHFAMGDTSLHSLIGLTWEIMVKDLLEFYYLHCCSRSINKWLLVKNTVSQVLPPNLPNQYLHLLRYQVIHRILRNTALELL